MQTEDIMSNCQDTSRAIDNLPLTYMDAKGKIQNVTQRDFIAIIDASFQISILFNKANTK